jgi:hypothetical protein
MRNFVEAALLWLTFGVVGIAATVSALEFALGRSRRA